MRRNFTGILWTAGLALGMVTAARPAEAITITFSLSSLGGNQYQYSYQVSDFDFDTDFGFSIFFDPTLYSTLDDPPPPVNADWAPITLQPDPLLPADGLYDALALVDNASLANPFTVSFQWLGGPGTVPGAQPFDVYQLLNPDPDCTEDCLRVIESGRTAPATQPIPEPGTLVLTGTGLLGLFGLRKKICISKG
jgi:hypothetical protein